MRRKRTPTPAWMNAPNLVCLDMADVAQREFVEKHGLEVHDTAQGPMAGVSDAQYRELTAIRGVAREGTE